MPHLRGRDLELEWRSGLRTRRGRLLTADESPASQSDEAVHAASDIRQRRIVLDRELRRDPAELSRILTHELFHFVWVRLSNDTRRSWEALIRTELSRGARGELGWSAEWRKRELAARGRETADRRWREYLCESFCDTGAWVYAMVDGHAEFTLATCWSRARRKWFEGLVRQRPEGLRI